MLFTPDFSKVGPSTFLAAVGQAFFSIGVGMGGMMTYGSYLPKDFSITRGAITVVFADTLVALLAGFVVFPAVFHYGLDIASGAGLIFQTLPVAFAQMPGGHIFAVLFFVMLSVAGITSMVGLLESVTAWIGERFSLHRHMGSAVVVALVTCCSVASVLSYGLWAEYRIAGMNFNDFAFAIPDKILLPLGGLLIATFAGWFMLRRYSEDEMNTGSGRRSRSPRSKASSCSCPRCSESASCAAVRPAASLAKRSWLPTEPNLDALSFPAVVTDASEDIDERFSLFA